jgi:hypothetical protein
MDRTSGRGRVRVRPLSAGRYAGRSIVLLVVLVPVLVAALVGCAPQSPDHSSWTDQARQSLDDTQSQVATVGLLLRLEQDDKVPGKYQQVVAIDAEQAAGTALEKFGGEQPEPRDDATYRRVTSLISDASDLLSQARIAIVRRDTAAYPGLVEDLDDMADRLSRASDGLS